MYTDLSQSLARAKERSGATTADDAYLTEVLTLSAARDQAGVLNYRPYFAAAKFLEQNRAQQQIDSADGVKFTGLKTPIESLLRLQASVDSALGLDVPAGFEAIAPDCEVCSNVLIRHKRRSAVSHFSP
jgi:hypothetical protein